MGARRARGPSRAWQDLAHHARRHRDLRRASSPLQVGRYHSLIVERASLPDSLRIVATAEDDPTEIHALRHETHPVWGVQFHPESVLTPHGKQLLRNFLELVSN